MTEAESSIPSLIPIVEDCRIRVDAPPFGSVEVNICSPNPE